MPARPSKIATFLTGNRYTPPPCSPTSPTNNHSPSMPSDPPSLTSFFPFLKPSSSFSQKPKSSPSPPNGKSRQSGPSGISTSTSTPPQSRSPAFSLTPEPLPDLKLAGYSSSTGTRLLSKTIAENIRTFVPARQQLHATWNLVYSLEQHGASLGTLYDRAGAHTKKRGGGGMASEGWVLVVKDLSGGTFGAFLNEALMVHEGRYFGNGECFLWKMESELGKENEEPEKRRRRGGGFRVFPYTGVNDYCIFCEPTGISIGGGDGKTGLFLDDRFETGISHRCPTFENESLSEENDGKFDILGVELWRIG